MLFAHSMRIRQIWLRPEEVYSNSALDHTYIALAAIKIVALLRQTIRDFDLAQCS
jgi:hypothetical protein